MLLSAPGQVTDFENDQQRKAWSNHLSDDINDAIAGIGACTAHPQYVNPAIKDVSAFQVVPIRWPGFPKLLYAQFQTKEQAYAAADHVLPIADKQSIRGGRALQDEYLEWFIHRDANGKIKSIDFTTETQEYWTFLFSVSKDLAARKYTEILGTHVSVSEISKGQEYNPYNKFNTTAGIIHLIQPNNTLPAELDIAAQSTLPRQDDTGVTISDIVSCTHCNGSNGLGEGGRNSDPTIAEQVNAVAASGCFLTIPNPVGLYIQGLDLSGWTAPPGVSLASCWKIVRGTPAVRASFLVPDGFKLEDFKIDGKAVKYAGQIADKISVFLNAAFGQPNAVALPPPRLCSDTQMSAAFTTFAALPKRSTRNAGHL